MTLLWILPLAFALSLTANVAQVATPTPAPSPSPSQPPQPAWHNPPNTKYAIVDPCGGPKELLNKFGPVPCVFVAGEGVVSAGFANINSHGGLEVRGNGPLGLSTNLPISGTANVYPSLFIAFGVSANSQLQLTPPSEVQVNTQRLGSFTTFSSPSVTYTQRVFFSPTKYTQLAVALGYTAPTEDAGINAQGPAYQIQLDFAQPLSVNWTFGGWWTFRNATSSSFAQGSQRGWSDPLGIYIAWSPAASTFEFLPVVYHSFNPNRTILVGQAVQLLGRHLSVAISYGGAETSSQSNGPFAQAFTFATNSSPRVLSGNLYYLINQSDLPPAPAPAPSATP